MLLDIAVPILSILTIVALGYSYRKKTGALKERLAKMREIAREMEEIAKKSRLEKNDAPPRYVLIPAFPTDDPDYRRILADIAAKPEWRFFLQTLKADLYDAVADAPTPEFILNAVGKIKGVKLLENALAKDSETIEEVNG